jgi:hypothetical protein
MSSIRTNGSARREVWWGPIDLGSSDVLGRLARRASTDSLLPLVSVAVELDVGSLDAGRSQRAMKRPRMGEQPVAA